MRVLLSGGAGFIGSHLCDLLLKKGFEVVACDNFITGKPSNISHIRNNPSFKFVEQDISNPFNVDGDLDYVMNFASPASPIDYLKIPMETLRVGSFGTYNMLEIAKQKKAVFLMASTSEVYGDPLLHPQNEEYWGNVNTIGPRAVYDEAKRFSEALTMSYHREYGLDTKIVRIFNTYGTRMRLNDGRVVPNFVYQALNNIPLTIYGDGKQTRSFCYVDDLIEGIFKLLTSDINTPVNIGNPHEMTILEFAEIIRKMTGSKSEIVFEGLPQDDPKKRQPDIAKAKQYLNWEPKIKIEDGLARTIAWFQFNQVPEGQELTEKGIMQALKEVEDPEIGLSIVDMELIKNIEIIKHEKGALVKVKMTLTTPNCPMMGYIVKSVKDKIETIGGVTSADVEIVF